ncbi:hypothetical protein SAMN04488531_0810 [Corynebacterium coyleae]|nr:hypothetical protein CCOY_11115 [Corynebacterium coyleae]SEB50110.1 hypothetical protein SAMN04488531_0810 [Corynebacterium coyleae]
MLSSTLDLFGDLVSMVIWFINGIQTGDPLWNFGSSF